MKRKLLTLLIVVVGLAVVWLVGGGLAASYQEKKTDLAWADTLEPMTAFAARYGKAAPSAAALELEVQAARLGIELAPHDAKDRVHPAEADRKAFEDVRSKLTGFVQGLLDRPDDVLEAPPAEVAAFLAARSTDVKALEEKLAGAGPITWEMDIERTFSAPIPGIAGLRAVSSVLVLDAFERARGGDAPGALAAVEDAFRINGGLRDRPELISQLAAMMMDRLVVGALRKLPDAPSAWGQRVAEHDYRQSLLRSIQTEAWAFEEYVRRAATADVGTVTVGGEVGSRTFWSRWVAAPFERPYLRLAAASYSESLRTTLVDLRQADPCSLDIQAFGQKVAASIPRWNILGQIAVPNLGQAWRTVGRFGLDVELTRKVLAARAAAAATKDGAWPAELPGLDSGACPGLKWVYQVAADGTMSLSPSREPFPGAAKAGLPLTFSARRPSAAAPAMPVRH